MRRSFTSTVRRPHTWQHGRSCAPLSPSYHQLRALVAGKGSGPAVVLGVLTPPLAADAARRHGLEEPSRSGDRILLEAAAAGDDGAFFCLRCLVSEPLEQKVRAIHRERAQRHGLDLITLASFALDDRGKPLSYPALCGLPEADVRPFTAQVVCSYDGSRGAGLPHWARTKLQGNRELKAYLREHGVLLISTWALLKDSSPTRVREALELFGTTSVSIERALAVHAAYCQAQPAAKAAYVQRTGKSSGWAPDDALLQQIASDQPPTATRQQLEAIDQAIRRLLTQRGLGSLDAQAEQGVELVDPKSLDDALESSEEVSETAAEQLARINAALERAMPPAVLAALQADQPKWARSPERLQCWRLYSEGAGQRLIAESVGKGQAWVSKLLHEKRLSTSIATAAALELKRLPAFAAVGRSVEGAERLVAALRNHLITPEQEGDIPPLRRAVAAALSRLSP